jgi:UDP-2,3-diacylglucosamine hydrolase
MDGPTEKEMAGPPDAPLESGAPSRVNFLSDCHLGHEGSLEERARQDRLLRFLGTLEPGRDGLIIVGDLFDFWFTYRRSIPRAGFAVLSRLRELRLAGMPVTFIAGNHDYWALPFLSDEIGIETFDCAIHRVIQGRRFLIAHGDGMGRGDLGYKLLKPVLRHPASIALYRLIHPDLGILLATMSSRLSRHSSAPDPGIAERAFREVAAPAFAAGHDVVVLGHLHVPVLREEGGKAMVILGAWFNDSRVLRVEGGRLGLERVD